MSGTPTIVTMGGGGFSMEPANLALDAYVLGLTGKPRPRVSFVPTASGDSITYLLNFYKAFARLPCEPAHLQLFDIEARDLREAVLSQDVVYVGGGNTANLLAIWRLHGVDRILREAWERGIVLAGVSAGSICWYESGTTDSFGPELRPIRGALGFLPGSHCPHYDGEAQRRPLFQRLIGAGELPDGWACDDGAAIRWDGTAPAEFVTSRPAAKAYRVRRVDGGAVEEPVEPRLLTPVTGQRPPPRPGFSRRSRQRPAKNCRMNQRTPLYDVHVALGARIVDFGGWDMPVQYEGIIPETHTTRRHVGLFDIGHMGRIEFVGADHVKAADWVVTSDVAALKPGRVKYGILSTERGTAIDDVLVYSDADRTHLVINAGGREGDLKHIREQIKAKHFNVRAIAATDPKDPGIKDSFLGCAQHMLALQGPNSEKLLAKLVDGATDLSKLGYYRMTRGRVIGFTAIISRTGYTGEDGFEVFFDVRESKRMWAALLEAGKDLGVKPIGLGARDALRTEAGMPLYGHELDLDTTPLEARLDFGVSLAKGPFLGKEALERQKRDGLPKVLVGFEVDTKRVPRNGCPLLKNGERVGVVTSGTFAPTLDKNIGMGFVPPSLGDVGAKFDVDIRGGIHGCTAVPLPFYKRVKK